MSTYDATRNSPKNLRSYEELVLHVNEMLRHLDGYSGCSLCLGWLNSHIPTFEVRVLDRGLNLSRRSE